MAPALTSPAARFDRTLLAAILVLAIILRLTAAYLLPDQNFPDAVGYRQAGRDLWSSGMLGTPYWMPLYPALVGLTGAGWGQLALDIALSTSAVWLIHRIVLVVFADEAAALLAAFMTHRAFNSHTALHRAIGSVSCIVFCGGHSSTTDCVGCP